MSHPNPQNDDTPLDAAQAAVAACPHVEGGCCAACLGPRFDRADSGVRGLIDSLDVGVYRSTPNGRLLLVNRALARMLGYDDPAPLLERGVRDADYDPSTARSSFIERIERDGIIRGQEACWKRADGSDVWVRETAHLVRDDAGTTQYYEGFVEDITNEREMWQALQESEERFRSVFDNAMVGIYRTASDGRVLMANPAMLDMLGYASFDELATRDVTDEYADPAFTRDDFVGAIERDGELRGLETTWLRRDGSAIPVRESARAVRGPDGDILYYEGTVEDLTARREAETALRQSEGAYRTVFESAQGALLIIDPATQVILDVNRRACELYGYDRHTFVGLRLDRLGAPRDRRRRRLAETLAGDEPYNFETRHRRSDGTEIALEVSASVIDFRGRRAILSVNHDVTAARAAADALREREELFRSVFEHSPLAVVLFDAHRALSRANPEFCAMLGYTEAELRGKAAAELTHPDDRAATEQLAAQLRAGERDQILMEKRYLHRDGHEVWCVTSVAALRNPDGSIRQTIAMLQDSSAVRALEEQLQHSQKMEAIGRLAGGIAHDFNNLLTAMQGYATLAQRRAAKGETAPEEMGEILATVERAAALTRQLLAFSRKQRLRPRVFNLVPLVVGMRPLLRRLLGEDVRISEAHAGRTAAVYADPGQIEQVVLNLAVNARDAMPGGGALTLQTRQERRDGAGGGLPPGDYAVLEVVDTGVGMDAGTAAQVFEPFFTTKSSGKGTGLGLSTAYGIVRQSGGDIEVESRPGAGTTMRVLLPAATAPEDPAAIPRPASEIPTGTETVLLVEDEPPLRALLERVLATAGYQVIVAADGAEGVARFRLADRPVDLVVTDVIMPNMGGPEMMAAIERNGSRPSVLFISGYSDDAEFERRLQDRQEVILQKPFSPSAFARAVRAALDARPADPAPA